MWLLYAGGARRLIVDNDDWEGPGGWLDVYPYPAWQKRFIAWQEAWTLNHARAVTCASDVLMDRTRTLTRPDLPINLLPNGPDERLRAVVAQAQANRPALRARFGWTEGPVVIYAGTVPLQHDMDMAVTALRQAVGSHPTLRWVIIATGDGLRSLEKSIREAGIDGHVQRCGFMPHDDLVERLVAADVAIYPYRDSNINRAKCSGKVIDYMACAKPAVVSDVGMNRAYIDHGKSGLLTPPGDAQAFGAALVQLLDHPTYASLLGRVAQQNLWSRFGWNERVATLEEFYRAACQPRRENQRPA
jgi:glycosyltransferase involved in cell wall biosynthesis